jgi:hypothetical protein
MMCAFSGCASGRVRRRDAVQCNNVMSAAARIGKSARNAAASEKGGLAAALGVFLLFRDVDRRYFRRLAGRAEKPIPPTEVGLARLRYFKKWLVWA